jgi:hypothetical protein
MTQLYVTTEVIHNILQHYMLSASSFTVYASQCQARILSAYNKTKMPYLADEVATVRYVGNKALQKTSCSQHFHICSVKQSWKSGGLFAVVFVIFLPKHTVCSNFVLARILRNASRIIIYPLQTSCSQSTAHNFHTVRRGMSQNGKLPHCHTISSCPQYSSPRVYFRTC